MPSEHRVELGPKAVEAFAVLSKSDQKMVVKQLEKLKRAPELGERLGNKMGYELAGYRKLYAASKRLRLVYEIMEDGTVDVIAIGRRDAETVYAVAEAEARRRGRLRRIS